MMNTMYVPPALSIDQPSTDFAEALAHPEFHGVLLVTDLPTAPFNEIQTAVGGLAKRPDLTTRLNNAYKKNKVFKDSFANGNGGLGVDMKRVLDLSPERLEAIRENDPELAISEEGGLAAALSFWENMRSNIALKLLRIIADAVGSEDIVKDASYNYRMVDYHARNEADVTSMVAPRCGDHQDFGTFTLIFPSERGLEVNLGGIWKSLPFVEPGTAILLFGWCTQIRSNGRLPAVVHRVADAAGVRQRTSAVLFCAPKLPDTPLEPVVYSGEERKYISGIRAGQLRGKMARKWQIREGTFNQDKQILEEHDILAKMTFGKRNVGVCLQSN